MNEHQSVMISTIDNPFNPFTQFDEWFSFDTEKGYNSCSYLARIAHTSEQLSDYLNYVELERAIDEIIEYDFMKIYKKVYNTNTNSTENTADSI